MRQKVWTRLKVNHIETVVMAEMAAELNSAAQRLVFLSDFCQFTTRWGKKAENWGKKFYHQRDEAQHQDVPVAREDALHLWRAQEYHAGFREQSINPRSYKLWRAGENKRVPKGAEAEARAIPGRARWIQQPGLKTQNDKSGPLKLKMINPGLKISKFKSSSHKLKLSNLGPTDSKY